MSPRDIYGLAARLGGLVFWVFAAFAFVHALASYFHVPIPAKYSVSIDLLVAATWPTDSRPPASGLAVSER